MGHRAAHSSALTYTALTSSRHWDDFVGLNPPHYGQTTATPESQNQQFDEDP